jgi:flagellar motor switch protein FliG
MNRDEFMEQYGAFVKRALGFAEKARREGLLMLDDGLDQEKVYERGIFDYGLKFVIDGTDPEIIEKILGNIIEQEKDEYMRRYKTIQKEAVLMIQQGFNPQTLYFILNSFTDIPLKDDKIYAALSGEDSYSLEPDDTDLPDEVVDIIEDEDYEDAETVVNESFVFNDIVRLHNNSIRKILRETDSQDMSVALKAANEEARNKVFKNVSKRAAAIIKEDMEYMGPVLRSRAEEAQQKIISTIRHLMETGEIC